jgi:hypothetical protein
MMIHRNPSPSAGRITVSISVPHDADLGWHRQDEDRTAVVTIEGEGGNVNLHLTESALRNLRGELDLAYVHLFAPEQEQQCLYCGDPHQDGPCRVVEAQA